MDNLIREMQSKGLITIQPVAHSKMLSAIHNYERRLYLWKIFSLDVLDMKRTYWYKMGRDNTN